MSFLGIYTLIVTVLLVFSCYTIYERDCKIFEMEDKVSESNRIVDVERSRYYSLKQNYNFLSKSHNELIRQHSIEKAVEFQRKIRNGEINPTFQAKETVIPASKAREEADLDLLNPLNPLSPINIYDNERMDFGVDRISSGVSEVSSSVSSSGFSSDNSSSDWSSSGSDSSSYDGGSSSCD